MVPSAVVLVVHIVSRCRNSGSSVGSVVAGTDIMVTRSSKTATGSRDGSDFGVAHGGVVLLTLPKLHTRATGVAVLGAGAVTLLLLVVALEEDGDGDGEEEEEAEWLLDCCWWWRGGMGELTLQR